jgi:hypothetical protein
MVNYSIIFQGLYKNIYKKNILNALNFSNNVILSTWNDSIDKKSKLFFKKKGILILESNDPGSVLSRTQIYGQFSLNIKRHLCGVRRAISLCKHQFVFKSRLDVAVDFNKMFLLYQQSNRNIASVNWTSVNPKKILGYPYYFHISDWVYVTETKKLKKVLKNVELLDEDDFIIKKNIFIRGIIWHTKFSAEQILSLILTNNSSKLYTKIGFDTISSDKNKLNKLHECVTNQYVNIDSNLVILNSSKYKGKSLQWMRYEKLFFNDSPYQNLTNLPLHLIKLILEYFVFFTHIRKYLTDRKVKIF